MTPSALSYARMGWAVFPTGEERASHHSNPLFWS